MSSSLLGPKANVRVSYESKKVLPRAMNMEQGLSSARTLGFFRSPQIGGGGCLTGLIN
jgi:hypothetical protein